MFVAPPLVILPTRAAPDHSGVRLLLDHSCSINAVSYHTYSCYNNDLQEVRVNKCAYGRQIEIEEAHPVVV